MHKLMYITQGQSTQEHLQNLEEALLAGVRLAQLRLKNVSREEYVSAGKVAKGLCLQFGAQLIINDAPEVAQLVKADAVHVGLNDTSIAEARKMAPGLKIGGTANTIEDIHKRVGEKADYIGLGPFRFTSTKEKLSPVLGIEGYRNLIKTMHDAGIQTPVYAIGGINAEDVRELMSAGVYGIAISGAITQHQNKKELIDELNNLLYHAENSEQRI